MLSKNQRKQILQLSKKKHRKTDGLFVAEGEKVVLELIASGWTFEFLFSMDQAFHPDAKLLKWEEMKQLTQFKTPSPVLGVFKMPKRSEILNEPITVAVDGVSDPGNLGTIIRLCDWFGFSELICSETTVDCFNPKVIQASMGSIVRVQCHYVTELADSLKSLNKPIYGATARGNSIYESKPSGQASYVFGSESHGISTKVTRMLDGELSIPHFREANQRAESLNVATATAIVLSELMRPPTQK